MLLFDVAFSSVFFKNKRFLRLNIAKIKHFVFFGLCQENMLCSSPSRQNHFGPSPLLKYLSDFWKKIFQKIGKKKFFFQSARKFYQKFLRAQKFFWAFFNAFSATKKFWRQKYCHRKRTDPKNTIFYFSKIAIFSSARASRARARASSARETKKNFFSWSTQCQLFPAQIFSRYDQYSWSYVNW